ncbi:hypothetical protein GPALN_002983 [Globodera pallida]|nr:hypothetical protein GPALN_002983 [Globodera pallida]
MRAKHHRSLTPLPRHSRGQTVSIKWSWQFFRGQLKSFLLVKLFYGLRRMNRSGKLLFQRFELSFHPRQRIPGFLSRIHGLQRGNLSFLATTTFPFSARK